MSVTPATPTNSATNQIKSTNCIIEKKATLPNKSHVLLEDHNDDDENNDF